MNPHAHAGKRKSHGAATALGLVAIARIGLAGVGGQHGRLAHAIALKNGVTGARLPGTEGFDQHGGRARDKQPHVGSHVTVQPCIGQHAHIQRGHAHENGRILEAGHHRLRLELGKPDHGTAIEQRPVNGHKQAVHMEDGQRMNQHIIGLPVPVHLEHRRIAEQIAVAEHGTLAAPGGATGVENGSQIIRLAGHHLMLITVVRSAVQQRARTVCAQRIDMAHAASESNLGHPAKATGRAHHHRWLGIGDEVLHLGTLIGGVQR